MRGWIVAAVAALGVGLAGVAPAQDVVADRRAGLTQMGRHMEAIGGVVQARGDQRQIVPRVDEMAAFFRTLPDRVPAASLTPPVAQGTQPGQSRALAAIDANRADFGRKASEMVTALGTLRAAAEAGGVNADLIRATGGTCANCHREYRAR